MTSLARITSGYGFGMHWLNSWSRCAGTTAAPNVAWFTPRKRGEGLVGHTFSTQEPTLIRDFPSYAHARQPSSVPGTVTAIAVPLRHTNTALGVLVAGSRTAGAFNEEHVRLLSLFAAQLSPALRVAQLHVESAAQRERAEQRRQEAEALAELMRLGETATLMEEVLDYVAATGHDLDHGGLHPNRHRWRAQLSLRSTPHVGRSAMLCLAPDQLPVGRFNAACATARPS